MQRFISDLSSILYVHVSVFLPALDYCGDHSFVTEFEIRKCDAPCFVLLRLFWISKVSNGSIRTLWFFSISIENAIEMLIETAAKYVDHLGYYGHLKILSSHLWTWDIFPLIYVFFSLFLQSFVVSFYKSFNP